MKKILAILLLLALLTGCTTAAPEVTQATGATQATEPTTVTEVTEVTEATDPTEATEPVTITIPSGPNTMTVHFIDVGQADCALIECNNAFALIDGGNTADGELVVEYLEAQGVQRLNLVVGTHPHEDHIGGLPEVLAAYPADNVWFSAIPYTNYTVTNFLNSVRKQGKEVVRPENGQTFHLGGAKITVLGPVRDDYEDVNDISLVLMVQYGDIRFLFTGDMESLAEHELIDSGADVKADVLKVGHHGSYSSTSYVFLRAVAPTYAVISVGAGNEYGHPHKDPMSRLRDADVTIYRTDNMYNITATTDGADVYFQWDNKYAQPWTPST